MGSAKQQSAIGKVMNLLAEWDKGSKAVRRQILQDFIMQNQNKTGPELEAEFSQAASLFLTRLTAWLRLTYMIGTCLNEQLRALQIFIAASSGFENKEFEKDSEQVFYKSNPTFHRHKVSCNAHKFLAEFLEVGGVLTVLEILGLKQANEHDKSEALRLLTCVANAGRKYKEIICESYGIRAIAECLAKSKSEDTQECARTLLQILAQGNPKFEVQVYKGLIALLPSSSPKAQQMAAQTLRVVQPIVKTANPSITEPLLNLLKTLHLEVQYEAIELIKDLMDYEVKDMLLKGLVKLLRPSKEELLLQRAELGEDPTAKMNKPLPVFVQQAASAKCIGVLARESNTIAEALVQLRVVHNLMYAMGNSDYADSQRQAAISLGYLCRTFPIVDEHCREAMGEVLYDLFMGNPESLYMNMSNVQADVLVSNKVNIPGIADDG